MLALLENLPKETLSSQLGFGAVLLLLGMLTVFIFLTILIYCTKLMSKICAQIGKGKKKSEDVNKTTSNKVDSEENAKIAAAIASAYDKSLA